MSVEEQVNKIEWLSAFKVVRRDLSTNLRYSAVMENLGGGRCYSTIRTTYPLSSCGPLAVFKDRSTAWEFLLVQQNHSAPLELWSCRYQACQNPPTPSMHPDDTTILWTPWKRLRQYQLPNGTTLADAVQLVDHLGPHP